MWPCMSLLHKKRKKNTLHKLARSSKYDPRYCFMFVYNMFLPGLGILLKNVKKVTKVMAKTCAF